MLYLHNRYSGIDILTASPLMAVNGYQILSICDERLFCRGADRYHGIAARSAGHRSCFYSIDVDFTFVVMMEGKDQVVPIDPGKII